MRTNQPQPNTPGLDFDFNFDTSALDNFLVLEIAKKAVTAMETARARLAFDRSSVAGPFFAHLALQLGLRAYPEGPKVYVDGRVLAVRGEWYYKLTDAQKLGVLAKATLHVALKHPTRLTEYPAIVRSLACDLVVNPLITGAGLQLPPDLPTPGQGIFQNFPREASADEYAKLLVDLFAGIDACPTDDDEYVDEEKVTAELLVDAASTLIGSFPGSKAEAQRYEAYWDVELQKAAMHAQGRGTLPGGLGRMVASMVRPKRDPGEYLQQFVVNAIDDEGGLENWQRPDRRQLSAGIYTPTYEIERIPELVIGWDSSGSTAGEIERRFLGALDAVLSYRPCRVHIVHSDCQVHRVDVWTPDDGPLTQFRSEGGGGTDHTPVWEWLREADVDPCCVICLTDGYTNWGQDPGVPVLWAFPFADHPQPPFGDVLVLAADNDTY